MTWEVLSTSPYHVMLEPFQKCLPALRHLLRVGAKGTRLGGPSSVRRREVEQGGQVGVETQELQGGAHKLTQASHSREAFIRHRTGRGKRRQEGPERIHGPPFFPEGQEGKSWERADYLEQKLPDPFGTVREWPVYEYAAKTQTPKEALE
jgi:hypothetical protein